MFSSPAWATPNAIDSPNLNRENPPIQSAPIQQAIINLPDSRSCQLNWQADTPLKPRSPLTRAGSDLVQSGCRWSYQPVLGSHHFHSIEMLPEKSIRMAALVDRKLRKLPRSVLGSRPDGIKASLEEEKPLEGVGPLIKEPPQSGSVPVQVGSFKADLVRSSGSYKAAALGVLSPFQSAPVLGNLASQSPPPQTLSSFYGLLSQAEGDQPNLDPELGVLRVQEQPTPLPPNTGGSNQSQTAQDPSACDPELGCFNTQPWRPPPPPRAPFVYLLARVDYFRSSNIFSAIDPVDDGLFRPGLTLFAAPPLGPKTYLIASVNGNFVRYSSQNQIDYNELLADVGIFQQLSPTMFAKVGWNYQQLFIYRNKIIGLPAGTRFLSDHALKLELSRRDQLNQKLSLSTFYQLRVGFAEPADRSRILNSLIASLNYDIQPILQVGLDYQFTLAHFTQQEREDAYHQIGVRLTYTMFRNTQFNLFAGYSFGRSSDPTVNFDGLVFGVSLGTSVPLF